eukprot:5266371-Pleurochrysis_carterae.AAC.1
MLFCCDTPHANHHGARLYRLRLRSITRLHGPARTRKQAMAEDHVGWSAAERAEIANHHANRSWTYVDRSDVPPG